MEIVKMFSRRYFGVAMILMLMVAALTACGYWYGLSWIADQLTALSTAEGASPQAASLAQRFNGLEDRFWSFHLPVGTTFFVFMALLVWVFARAVLKGLVSKGNRRRHPPVTESSKVPQASKRDRRENKNRIYLHLLTVLQREGRLLDFFSENLDAYGDDQIGAAVRNIHASCTKILEKSLAPSAILDEDEGSEISVESGFDPGAIKLTGNVSGDPPFRGRVVHRGWRAKRLELPTLADTQDAQIISPAEVEVA